MISSIFNPEIELVKNLKLVAMTLLMAAPVVAFAQDEQHPAFGSKYLLDVGVFFPERAMNLGAGVSAPGNGGIGLAYNYLEFDAGVDNSTWQGSVEIVYEGPFAFVSFYW